MDLLHTLNAERERRCEAERDLAVTKARLEAAEKAEAELAATKAELAATKADLANTQAKLEAAEKALEDFRGRHWTSHMYEAAEGMGPGGALIATVGAPVMAAPLAVATVVKGFQSVGVGIGSLFSGRERGRGGGPPAGGEGTAPARLN